MGEEDRGRATVHFAVDRAQLWTGTLTGVLTGVETGVLTGELTDGSTRSTT